MTLHLWHLNSTTERDVENPTYRIFVRCCCNCIVCTADNYATVGNLLQMNGLFIGKDLFVADDLLSIIVEDPLRLILLAN